MLKINPVSRANLEASIADQRTVLEIEALFDAVIEIQAMLAERVGSIVWSAAPTYERGLPARGTSLLRAEYPELFAKIGTAFGAVDADHFSIPDIGGRVVAGSEAVAARITSAVSGFSGATLGAAGGAQSHVLTVPEMPAHTHVMFDARNGIGVGGNVGGGTQGTLNGTTTGSTGGGGAHLNMQPTIVLNAFILY
jgi:microcystin-dependent protein